MARLVAKISAPSGQLFECRDCAARCCRVPWSIRLDPGEVARYASEPWVAERAGAEALRVLARGVLPMREQDRGLQCVFLDGDGMCGMQKKFGHEYIPRSCQAFPFGFLQNERGAVTAQLSRLCPSIRENYGRPVDKQLKAKLHQRGSLERMTTAMSTTARVILSQGQYLRVARYWEDQLAAEGSTADALARIYDQTLAFEEAIPASADRATDGAVEAALRRAGEHAGEPLTPRRRTSLQARLLYGYLLGNLCYPSRVRQAHRVGPPPFAQTLRSFGNKVAWMCERGTVDLLFAPRPVALGRVRAVAPFLAGAEGEIVRDYLRILLERRGLFSQPRYLMSVVVDLCLAAVTVSRFARCLAAASDRAAVLPADVHEGVSVAELVLGHVSSADEGKTMKNLRLLMLLDRVKLRNLLASEL